MKTEITSLEPPAQIALRGADRAVVFPSLPFPRFPFREVA